jgi:diguanylate cyclase (GGDEF)-like protein
MVNTVWETLWNLSNVSRDKKTANKIPTPQDDTALLDASAAISSKLEITQVAKETGRQICRFLRTDFCRVSSWDPETAQLIPWEDHNWEKVKDWRWWKEPRDPYAFPLFKQVLKTGTPAQVQLSDPGIPAPERDFLSQLEAKSLLLLPLVSHEMTVGLIDIYDLANQRTFSEYEIRGAQLLAHNGSIAMERARLLKDTERRAAELEALRQASLSLTSSLELPTVLNAILGATLSLMEDELDTHIFLYDGKRLTFGAAMWADGRQSEPWAEPREDGLTYSVAREAQMIVVPDMKTHPLFVNAPPQWNGAIIGIPLVYRDSVVGVMNIAYQNPREFEKDELSIINLLADQAAIAIVNANLHRTVRQQALTDELTQLPNRRAFNQHLEDEVRRSRRYKRHFTLMMMDLDGFKRVNDTFGHPVGDRTLARLSTCLQDAVRDTDFLARFGGDEFVLLLPETGVESAKPIANKLTHAVETCSVNLGDKIDLCLSLSIGIAGFPQNAEDGVALIKAADDALYKVKSERLKR